MSGDDFGTALRTWRGKLSLRRLGSQINVDHTYLWEIEKGRKPGSVEVAQLCDDALGAGGELVALAQGRPIDVLALDFTTNWKATVETITHLCRGDMERRQLLTRAAFAAAAFASPVLGWLTPGESDAPHGAGSRRVGRPEVESIQAMTRAFRQLDNRFGGGQARGAVVGYLDGEVAPLLKQGRYDAQTGVALTAATAELSQLAGWMSYDYGLHGLAQRYMIQALRLARSAGDTALGVEILAAMSHQCTYLGQTTEAITLAEAAGRSAGDAGVPALVAESAVMAAHAHACGGDSRAAALALSRAEKSLDAADRSQDPQWMRYFDEAYLSAKFGHTFVTLDEGQHAITFAERSLNMNHDYVRGRAFNFLLLARAHLQREEPLAALEPARTALELTKDLASARAMDYLADLNSRFARYDSEPDVQAFRQRARALLDDRVAATR